MTAWGDEALNKILAADEKASFKVILMSRVLITAILV
jgi:hypothetical protein